MNYLTYLQKHLDFVFPSHIECQQGTVITVRIVQVREGHRQFMVIHQIVMEVLLNELILVIRRINLCDSICMSVST